MGRQRGLDMARLLIGTISLLIAGTIISYRRRIIETVLACREAVRVKIGLKKFKFEPVLEEIFVKILLIILVATLFFAGISQIYLVLSASRCSASPFGTEGNFLQSLAPTRRGNLLAAVLNM
jgi:hypothetical protein